LWELDGWPYQVSLAIQSNWKIGGFVMEVKLHKREGSLLIGLIVCFFWWTDNNIIHMVAWVSNLGRPDT